MTRCKECDEFLCAVCTEAHKRTKVTKGHSVVNVDDLKRYLQAICFLRFSLKHIQLIVGNKHTNLACVSDFKSEI